MSTPIAPITSTLQLPSLWERVGGEYYQTMKTSEKITNQGNSISETFFYYNKWGQLETTIVRTVDFSL